MRHRFRLGRRARLLPVLGTMIALAAVPSVAAASSSGATAPGFDPQETNTPYLAWNGEQVRLEKCVPAYGLGPGFLQAISPTATFTVEEWSGASDASSPSVDPATEKIFYSSDFDHGAGGFCAEGDVVSLDPGFAQIELDVSGFTVPPGTAGYGGPAQPFLAHQFLVGWMTLNTPSLTNMSSSSFGADPGWINDPSGNGTETAGGNPAFLDVNVTGTIPINGPLYNLVGQSSVTLPQDWATLAQDLATDDNADNTTAYDDWDTSGSNQDVSGHVPAVIADDPGCASNPFGAPAEVGDSGQYDTLDNVDNCSGGGADGPFSTAFSGGGFSDANTTIGPFDPVNASSTDLADGDLNWLDAPMPAARVDVAIAPNSGSSTDISGVGSLQAANKLQTYSRDFHGNVHPNDPSDLYAPFYDAYIPATARPTDDSSGIDGALANDFPGFLDISGDGGAYHFWDTYPLGSDAGGTSDCLSYSTDDDPQGLSYDPANVFRPLPSGNNDVAVYTDEHGEAQVEYVPGEGYYFDNLGADKNADGGCDLESIGPGAITTLGTATITATAKYPYKAVDYPNETSNSVTETVTNQFDKSLSYVPKGASADDQLSRIVIAHAQDIDGSPYAQEVVCFSVDSNAEGVTRFSGYINGVYYGGSTPAADPNGASFGRTCLNTDSNGNAAIEVLDSNSNSVNVIADFVDEGLLRDISVNFAVANSSGGTVPAGPATKPGVGTDPKVKKVGGSGTKAPTKTQVKKTSKKLAKYLKKHQAKKRYDSVKFVRLLTPVRGNHYLVLRVQSHHSTARVALTFGVRQGKKVQWLQRKITVRTNRTVKYLVVHSVSQVKGVHLIG